MSAYLDPVRWTKSAVGTRWRYAMTVTSQVIAAAIIVVFGLRNASSSFEFFPYFLGGFMTLNSILYISALRNLMLLVPKSLLKDHYESFNAF